MRISLNLQVMVLSTTNMNALNLPKNQWKKHLMNC